MADFEKLALTAKRLIEANGRTVTVSKLANTATDATKPWRTTSVPVAESVSGRAVFVDPSSLGRLFENVDDVKRGTQVVLFAAENDGGFELETFDTITDFTAEWKILRTKVLNPASVRLLYAFEVRR